MVVNEASHIFIFCMDRINNVLNIFNVEIVKKKKKKNGRENKNKLCMFYLADLILNLE